MSPSGNVTAKNLNIGIDYRKLLVQFEGGKQLLSSFYCTTIGKTSSLHARSFSTVCPTMAIRR